MEDASRFGPLIERFASIKEKYGDDYPIIFYDPNIESKEKTELKDVMNKNSSIHLFSESEGAFQFAQSLGISFILIVPSDCDERKIAKEFQELRNIYQRRMFDFEEEALSKDLFKENSDHIRKSMKVYVFCTLFDCLTESTIKEDEEEIMTLSNIKDIAKEFQQEFLLIWYDPDINTKARAKLEGDIEIKIDEGNIYIEFEDLCERLKKKSSTPYHLIMSRSDKAERVLQEIGNNEDLLGLYIYCKKFEKEKKIENEKVEVRSTLEELIPRIKEGVRTRSKLKNTFPAFATNFDASDRSGIYKLHYYLKGFINFHNRKQAKRDFIKLARKIYQDSDKELTRFDEKYNEYNQGDILRWYTKESPIYKLINNCLRIASPDSILYCRLILKDLERAIREQYKEKWKNFHGFVYRGACISTEEWEKLERNIGEEIEMHGFLSTTVDQGAAVNFLKADPQNKVLIKIIIPPLPEEDEQGFANISKFSEFQNEQEILFNVMSKFKILQVGVSKIDEKNTKCRHLVLLYGAQLLRKYSTKQKPSIEIMLELPRNLKCNLCGSIDKLFGYEEHGETLVNCLECLAKGSMPKDTPLIALNEEQEKQIRRTLQGILLKSKKKVTFANSGYKCHDCNDNAKEKYYKWMSYDGNSVLVQCSECLQKNKRIENKILISESSPYAIWQEFQEESETIISDYQVDFLQRIGSENPQNIYVETQESNKCLQYAKKLFDKIVKRRRREVFKCNVFATLGDAFRHLGEYQPALKCFADTQDLVKFIGQERSSSGVALYQKLGMIHYELDKQKEALAYYNQALDLGRHIYPELHPTTASFYHGIAIAYTRLNDHENALTFFTKSLDIQISIHGEKHPTTADGYNSLGLFYQNLGRHQDALEYFTLALKIQESIYGEKHSLTATSYNNVAIMSLELGDYQNAIKLFNKAINIQKAMDQEEHPLLAISYSNLAKVYQICGQYEEALELSQKALHIDRLFYGEEHSSTASSLISVGLILQNLGDYQKALEFFLKAANHIKSLFGEKHFETAASYVNIGTAYQNLGESRKALEYFQKALNIQNILFVGPHFHKATSYNNIAMALQSFGQYQKSLEYQEIALEMKISLYGEKHPEILKSYNNIGLTYESLEQHSKAIEYNNKALEMGKLVFGELHPGNALSYHNLAVSYQSLGDSKLALEYSTKALAIQRSFHKEDHTHTATIYNNLGSIYTKLEEFKRAKECLEEALRMRRSVLTENHPDIGVVYQNLGLFFEHLKKPQKALKYHLKAVAIFEAADVETHPSTVNSYDSISSNYRALGNHQEAIKYQRKSLQIKQKIFGENHGMVATSYNYLGVSYSNFGEYQKARDCFLQAIKILESLGREKHPDAYNLYWNLSGAYFKLRNHKKAIEYYAKACSLGRHME